MLMWLILAVTAVSLWKGTEIIERLWPSPAPDVTSLHPIVAAKQADLIAAAAKIGIAILITDGLRTNEEQNALYRQGRGSSGQVVTNVKGGESYHNYGLAIDFALRTKDNDVIWDLEYDGNGSGSPDWLEVVDIAKGLGFTWGGDWEEFRDYPHLQMDFGYSIQELRRGGRPPQE
ncbi:M15 family metallopeptidase [Paenibacillus sepulcri]|uniref:M15 family metallopeptidase n=2 Tax=Paenibacillus sepulcri TaxID=359917 RepID=A0ABS7CB96_9BACL|nr:M15 family metallopeptidase [Paenibacillus sepulcri]